MKAASIVFFFSAACVAVLSIFRFADGSPGSGAILLAVALVQVGVGFAVRRLGTAPPPPV